MSEQKYIPELRFSHFDGEWIITTLGAIAKIYDGTHQTPNYIDSGVQFVSVENIVDINATDKYISVEDFDKDFKTKPKKNDILMTRITAGVIGATAIVNDNNPLAYYVSLALIRVNRNVDVRYLNQTILNERFKRELHKRIIHVAFPKKINLGDIGKCEISLPSLPEQQKIASFFTVIDQKISQLKQKKILLEQYKKGVMHKIFYQEIRFKDDDSREYPNWTEKYLGEVVDEYCEKSVINDQHVLLSSAMGGIFLQSDYFNNDVASKDNTGYKVVPKGYFTYRSMSDTGRFTFNIQNIVDYGIVSPAYPVFKSKGSINNQFLYNYLNNSDKIINDILSLKEGGTRYAMSFAKFSKLKVELPTLNEQTKIANFLSAIDDKINHIQKQIDKAEVWKKGLMQQMFV